MIKDEDKINKYFFFGKHPNLLMPFIENMDTLKGHAKRSVAIDIVEDATLDELIVLEGIRTTLALWPAPNSFLFRLDQAIQMRRYIASFERADFSQLNHFLETEPDVLRCYGSLILALSETASNALVAKIPTFGKKLSFYQILKSMQPITSAGCETSLLKSFKAHFEALEDEQEENNQMSIGRSRDAVFGSAAASNQARVDTAYNPSTDYLSTTMP